MKKRRLFILFTLFFVLTFVFVRFSFRYATKADDIEIELPVVDYVYNEFNENEVYYGEHDYYWNNDIFPSVTYSNYTSLACSIYTAYLDDLINDLYISNSLYDGTNGMGCSSSLYQYYINNSIIDFQITRPNPQSIINQYFSDTCTYCYNPLWESKSIFSYSSDLDDLINPISSNIPSIIFIEDTNELNDFYYGVGICYAYVENTQNNSILLRVYIINNGNNHLYWIDPVHVDSFYTLNNIYNCYANHTSYQYSQYIDYPYAGHVKTCGRCNHESLEGHSMVLIGMTGRMRCVKCGYISNSGVNPGIESKGDGCL